VHDLSDRRFHKKISINKFSFLVCSVPPKKKEQEKNEQGLKGGGHHAFQVASEQACTQARSGSRLELAQSVKH
jgi:hypothetical protein